MDAKLRQNLRDLAEILLDNDEGISEEAYDRLLSVLDPADASKLSIQVDATEGHFYVCDPIEWND